MAPAASLFGAANHHEDSFVSIFPLADFTTPTPETTPNIGTIASSGEDWGSFVDDDTGAAVKAAQFQLAWSMTTRYLSEALNGQLHSPDPLYPIRDRRLDVKNSIYMICGRFEKSEELKAWIANEVTVWLRSSVLPQLARWQQDMTKSAASEALKETLQILKTAQDHYLDVLYSVRPADTAFGNNGRDYGNIVSLVTGLVHIQICNALPRQRIESACSHFFLDCLMEALQRNSGSNNCWSTGHCNCRIDVQDFPLHQIRNLGLDGSRAFAKALDRFVVFIAKKWPCFAVDWSHQISVVPKLQRWIETILVPAIEQCLETSGVRSWAADLTPMFVKLGVQTLGRERADAQYDYVKTWPASKGALLDLKEYLAVAPSEKSKVCSKFTSQIQHRLLHAGASTTEILSIYINVIHAFRLLDTRGVLLEKVSGQIRSYLRSRDDTVGIIAASFLADVDENGNIVGPDDGKVCADITVQVSKSALEDARDHHALNLNDMDWMPDPMDAGPDYKAAKSEDIVDYILGLFHLEDFIKEVTKFLAQRLLEAVDPEYVKETRLIELLKSRKLDASKLQAAEVMLKDVRDSVTLNRRINPHARPQATGPVQPKEIQSALPDNGIDMGVLYQRFRRRMTEPEFRAALHLVAVRRGDLYFPKRVLRSQDAADASSIMLEEDINYDVQVVSSFFWPQMRANEFALPPTLAGLDQSFNDRFGQMGNQRRLEFRRALARVTVELQLEDRVIFEEDVPAWRASVVNAFGADQAEQNIDEMADTAGSSLGVDELVERLQMEEELVNDALRFWIGKQVLYETAPGRYAVLERLDMDTVPVQPSQQPQHETVSAVMSQDSMLREGAPMFETFILNMLQNGGPKEVRGMMGITGMMKMVLPTFTYGDDEVEWLLSELLKKGAVVREGDVWKANR